MYNSEFHKLRSKSIAVDSNQVQHNADTSSHIVSNVEPLKINCVANPNVYVPNNTVILQHPPHIKVGLMPKPPPSIVPSSMRPPKSSLRNQYDNLPRDRDCAGNILVAPKKRFVDPSVVPYMFALSSSSPFSSSPTAKTPKKEGQLANVVAAISSLSSSSSSSDYNSLSLSSSSTDMNNNNSNNNSSDWITCFDEEVGASYYYNSQTGEATWIPPT